MHSNTKSLLEELDLLSKNRDMKHIVESRGHNIITSAINLLELISKHYSVEQSQILERKFLSAIKNRDKEKFSKSLKKKDI